MTGCNLFRICVLTPVSVTVGVVQRFSSGPTIVHHDDKQSPEMCYHYAYDMLYADDDQV